MEEPEKYTGRKKGSDRRMDKENEINGDRKR
jgi:hypothetical protein